jgi:putative NADH-flavin reductase
MPLRPNDAQIRLFVIGATGRTGRLLLEQALGHGHRVTAFVRDGAPLKRAGKLDIVLGDVRSADQLAAAMPGDDVVVSALGHSSAGEATILRDAAEAALAALQSAGVGRAIIVSQGLAFPSGNPIVLALKPFFARTLADSLAMEERVRAADIDWTIVRPPRLTSGGTARGYRVYPNAPGSGWSMDRADLAAFLLDEAEKGKYRRAVVGID